MFSRHVRSLSSDDVERVIRQHSSNKFRESISGRPCFNSTLSCIDCLPYKILFLETPVLIFFFSRINVYYCFDGFSFFFYLCNTMKIGIRYFTKKNLKRLHCTTVWGSIESYEIMCGIVGKGVVQCFSCPEIWGPRIPCGELNNHIHKSNYYNIMGHSEQKNTFIKYNRNKSPT